MIPRFKKRNKEAIIAEKNLNSQTNSNQYKSVIYGIFIFICLFSSSCYFAHYYGVEKYGKPLKIIKLNDPSVQTGEQASGEYAWKVVTDICLEPHVYNSKENIRVEKYLRNEIRNIQTQFIDDWNCKEPSPFIVFIFNIKFSDKDMINLSFNQADKKGAGSWIYYESNNILLRLKGKGNNAFLITSHYDSALDSLGVTDDGIAVGSMISSLYSISRYACNHTLEHDLIFNFSNAEEIGLLGAYAFRSHPWFKDVKGFMNLGLFKFDKEGTGVSGTDRSFVFQSNNFKLISMFLKQSQYPHASIIAQTIMRFIKRFLSLIFVILIIAHILQQG